MRPSFRSRAMAWIALTGLAVAAVPSAAAGFSLLDFYREEIARLVDTPGTSRSVAAGRLNVASWAAEQRGGLYLAFEDVEGDTDIDDITGVIATPHLGFGMRHVSRGDLGWTDYTLGLSLGNRSMSAGIAYSWDSGDKQLFGDTERLASGSIWRWGWGSLGWNTIIDFDADQSLDQVDFGLRPFGPRLTLFGDFLGFRRTKDFTDFDYADEVYGYGVEWRAAPGVGVAVRGDDEGNLGFRLSLALDGVRPSVRHRIDDDGDRLATTYAVEFGRGPSLRELLPASRRRRYPELHWKGSIAYRRYHWFDDRPRLLSLLSQLDAIAEDPKAEGVLLNLSGLQASVANQWELRAQLAGLRARGKRVIIYADRLGASGYLLASVADELWLDPMGGLDLRGLNFGRSYYARLLEKAGVGFEEWRYFRYKSAVESFTRTGFSEGEREQLDDLLHDFYESVVADVLAARGIERSEWDRMTNELGEVLPHEAESLGLVDAVGSLEDLRDDLENTVARPGGDLASAPVGSVFGDRVWRHEEWGEPDRIALLYAIGPCAMDSGIEGRKLSRLIRQMREDPRVKAVVLRVDSPGGDPLPSDLVARELRKTAERKPVVVSQGQVAGSGGYWISMDGDEIFASPFTVTGSIGVISGHVYDAGVMDRLGIDYDHLQIGRSADLRSGPTLPLLGVGLPHRPSTEEERARAEQVIRDLYGQFVAAVAAGRGMSEGEVEAIAQGHVYSGTRGKSIGLVDEIGGLWGAIARAKELAGLEPGASIQLVEGPELGLLPPGLLRPQLVTARLRAAVAGPADVIALGDEVPASPPAAKAQTMPEVFEGVLDAEQWRAIPTLERIYLQWMLSSQGRPALLMEPLGVEVGW